LGFAIAFVFLLSIFAAWLTAMLRHELRPGASDPLRPPSDAGHDEAAGSRSLPHSEKFGGPGPVFAVTLLLVFVVTVFGCSVSLMMR
jgi:hypothetical protein